MSTSRVLGVLIGMVLVAAVATAIVKGGDETAPAPSAQAPTEEPSTTFTFTGAPTFLTESPVIPSSSVSGAGAQSTAGATLPRTGDGSFAPQAALLLLLAVAGGLSVWRTARRPSV